jgi:hypothetical protein
MKSMLFPDHSPEGNALNIVLKRLPADWKATRQRPYQRRRWSPDLILRLRGPKYALCRIIVAARPRIHPEDVASLADQLHAYAQALGGNVIPLVTAPFLDHSTREQLFKADLSYADATGNLRVVSPRPELAMEALGANRDPAGIYAVPD